MNNSLKQLSVLLIIALMASVILVIVDYVNTTTHDSLELVSDGLYIRLSDPIIAIGKDDNMMIYSLKDWQGSKTGFSLLGVKYSQLLTIANYYDSDENVELYKIKDSYTNKPYHVRLRKGSNAFVDSSFHSSYCVELIPSFSNNAIEDSRSSFYRIMDTLPDRIISNYFKWDYHSSFYIEFPNNRVLIPDSFWVDEDNIQHAPVNVDNKLLVFSDKRDTIAKLWNYPVFEETSLMNKRVRLSLTKESNTAYRGVLIP